jgi:LysM repeat protein
MRRRLLCAVSVLVLTAPATASAAFEHTVLPGESLTTIAASDGLSVAQLAAANGLSADAQLVSGSTVAIPPQGAPASVAPVASGAVNTSAPATSSAAFRHTVVPGESLTSIAQADGLSVAQLAAANGLSPGAQLVSGTTLAIPSHGAATAPTSTEAAPPATASNGSYVVQPGDTLSAIAARDGVSVSELASTNGLDPGGALPAGSALVLPASDAPPPAQAPAVGSTVTGRMTWFGGPDDPDAQGAPASGLGWLSNGMAYYNEGSLSGQWLIHFPWGQTEPMTQIDVGPAPWTGNSFDLAYSALPGTPYNQSSWPNPTVVGTYEGP